MDTACQADIRHCALRRNMDCAGNCPGRKTPDGPRVLRNGKMRDRHFGDIRAGYRGSVVAAPDYPRTGAARGNSPDQRIADRVQYLAGIDCCARRDGGTDRAGQSRPAGKHRTADLATACTACLACSRLSEKVPIAFLRSLVQPRRIRWRPILHNLQTAGFEALPITGLLSFLMGVVIAYQGADQLAAFRRQYFHSRSGRPVDAARAVPAVDCHYCRGSIRLCLRGANRHHEDQRGNRCAAHHRRRSAGTPGTAKDRGLGHRTCHC